MQICVKVFVTTTTSTENKQMSDNRITILAHVPCLCEDHDHLVHLYLPAHPGDPRAGHRRAFVCLHDRAVAAP